jgi:uncharacterized protein YjbI with pentapeptide repeats
MSTQPARAPQPPVIRQLLPPAEMVAGSASSIEAGDTREAERYVGTDFGGNRLAHTTFRECVFDGVSFEQADLRGVHLIESLLTNVGVAALAAPRSSWRDVVCRGSRLGSAELYESTWRSVMFENCKIGYVNARSVRWQDVVFRDCVLDELDLVYASVERLAFERCEVGTLELADARLADVDLRGARLATINGLAGLAGCWITEQQLMSFAPLLAQHLKISVG